jgi:TonB family protein
MQLLRLSDSLETTSRRVVEPQLRLLVELPPRHRVFFGNIIDMLLARNTVRIRNAYPPSKFWPDVFVPSGINWTGMFDSALLHAFAVVALISLTHLYLTIEQREIKLKPRNAILHYQVSEYLPPVDTGSAPAPKPRQGQPALAKQKIVSLPPRPDNFEQTIISPVDVKLPVNMALPNVYAWNQAPAPQVPTTVATRNTPITLPQIPVSVIAPPPDPRNLAQNRLPDLAPKVIEPPPDARNLNSNRTLDAKSNVIEPPPTVDDAKLRTPRELIAVRPAVIEPPPDANLARNIGSMNIGNVTPTVAAPKIEVAQQHTVPQAAGIPSHGGNGAQSAPAVPPPPTIPQGAFGNSPSAGQLIALNLHPANVTGPVNVPPGRRSGEFAAGPEGKPNAPGTPDIQAGGSGKGGNGSGTAGAGKGSNGTVPAGIVIGNAPGAPPPGSAVIAGTPQKGPSFNDAQKSVMMAAARPPRLADIPRDSTPPASIPDAPRVEDKIFNGKKSYQMSLNMPNLNSTGGSWIIRFAQLDNDKAAGEITAPVAMNKVDPAYPADMIRDGVEGTVMLYAIIHKDGTVGGVRVLRGLQGRLDENARIALQRWHFRPGTKNGQAVDLEAVVQIPFRAARVAF